MDAHAAFEHHLQRLRSNGRNGDPLPFLTELSGLRQLATRMNYAAVVDCSVALERAYVAAIARGDAATVTDRWLDTLDTAVCLGATGDSQALRASVALQLRG